MSMFRDTWIKWCRDGHAWNSDDGDVCPACGKGWKRMREYHGDYKTGSIFPWEDYSQELADTGDGMVHFTGRRQRDAVLAKMGLTLDGYSEQDLRRRARERLADNRAARAVAKQIAEELQQ